MSESEIYVRWEAIGRRNHIYLLSNYTDNFLCYFRFVLTNMSQAEFDKAAEEAKKLSKKPSDDDLLKLYGLFKQATIGDNNTDKPGMFDLKGKYKWEAWNANKSMAKDTAQKQYVDFVKELKAKQ